MKRTWVTQSLRSRSRASGRVTKTCMSFMNNPDGKLRGSPCVAIALSSSLCWHVMSIDVRVRIQ